MRTILCSATEHQRKYKNVRDRKTQRYEEVIGPVIRGRKVGRGQGSGECTDTYMGVV